MPVNVQHDGFTSAEYSRNRRKYTGRYFNRRYSRAADIRERDDGSTMLTKIGICGLLAGLVLLSDIAGSKDIIDVSADTDISDNYTGEDYPGRLRFVELPGIIQVFASDAKARLDVDYAGYRLNDEKTVMEVYGIRQQMLPSPMDGTIKTVSMQNSMTKTELSVDGDIILRFCSNGEAAVEEGQPITAGDTIYRTVERVEISVYRAGRPVNPEEFFNMESNFSS